MRFKTHLTLNYNEFLIKYIYLFLIKLLIK